MSVPISILILTKNEEIDLPGCLDSVAWSDDIHVYDSFSTDATVEIAQRYGATVTQRKFDNYASQRNCALQNIEYAHDWLLILDADERSSAALAQEMARFVADPPADAAACRIRRRDYFCGAWLKHAQISPYYIRLVRPAQVHYERDINEVLKADGRVIDLAEPFDHYPFSKGIHHWIDKHNRYSTMEAEEVIKSRKGHAPFSLHQALFGKDFNERRYHQKELFYRLPLRPLVKWMYMMLVRRAFLDGYAGITYSTLQSMYEYMIVLKTRELEQRERAESEGVPA